MNLMLFLEKIHGHVGVLGIALALHPWFALRKATRPNLPARISAYTASGFILATNVLGWVVYPAYREDVKRRLYAESDMLGNLFEFKEHLAWFCLCLAVIGASLMVRATTKEAAFMRQTLRQCYFGTALLAAVSAAIGIYLSSIQGF